MAHFARIENGVVVELLVIEQEVVDTGLFGDPSTWVQTSFNTSGGVHYSPTTRQPDGGVALRANFGMIGMIYDAENDVFYNKAPARSWTISGPDWIWKAPVPAPDDGKLYRWSEKDLSWVEIPTS